LNLATKTNPWFVLLAGLRYMVLMARKSWWHNGAVLFLFLLDGVLSRLTFRQKMATP
jgi:hypothetical protein